MKTPAFLLSTLLILAGAAPLTAQETGKATIEQLIEQLGDSDYEARKAAEKQLLGRGKEVLEQLKKSAKNHDDPEVQWRAGRLARRIEDRSAGESSPPRKLTKREGLGKKRVVRGGKADEADRSGRLRALDDMMKNLDRAFEGHGLGEDAQREIERAMEQVRKSLRQLEIDGVDGEIRDGASIRRGSNSMKMSQGPDGVRVEITETGEDGKQKIKVYEAKDMESFKKKYPGVLKGRGVRVDVGEMFGEDFPFDFSGRILRPRIVRDGDRVRVESHDGKREAKREKKSLRRKSERLNEEKKETVGERKRLGFHVGEIAPAIRSYLGLKGGLMVDKVVDGTLADKIGLRKGDIVTRVGKKRINEVGDVADALDELKDGKVVVTVIRRGREVRLN